MLPLFLSPFLNRRCKWARDDDYCKGGGGYRECGEGNVCSVLFCPACLTPSLLRGIWLLPHLLQLHHPHPFRVKKEVDLVCLPESTTRRKQKQRRTLPKLFRLVPEKKVKRKKPDQKCLPSTFCINGEQSPPGNWLPTATKADSTAPILLPAISAEDPVYVLEREGISVLECVLHSVRPTMY